MRIVFSLGDPHGIGPEIILKGFLELRKSGHCFAVAGSYNVLEYYRRRLDLPVELERVEDARSLQSLPACSCGVLPVFSVGEPDSIEPGTVTAGAGALAKSSIMAGAELCRSGAFDALVTAPIHKESLALAGSPDSGHTGMLARMFGVASPTMLFADRASGLKVALLTIHEPLERVPELVRQTDIEAFLARLAHNIETDFGMERPSIAVLGLNPHASDGGVMGREEKEFISPAIARLRERMHIEGPFPADGFFGARMQGRFDCVVAMYHDQGLLPFKVLAFHSGVNVTLGLPIVRTSPDHGTGFDIAGKGSASAESLHEAALLAARIAENRNRKTQPSP
ncbi:4-hydroxythreonine-4-phosphate dehydrogenase PdxA [Chlorobium sp. N1]|uniref:4-hydroxythreonine-4-phosphate dehydrogenase PdxA n=1 Tax=Chlorobium sp. N1 TaxID=2491138 RepID=UPI00103EEB9F|nr:4-hydroxythreonine-4-phosphate dehydrogenase PdxA [Chlorobium sp. N1]TCD47077.1 4-hydroxythreonine-4-phosphate dehydrogenase PdxA [Chlorobium sp. N1]